MKFIFVSILLGFCFCAKLTFAYEPVATKCAIITSGTIGGNNFARDIFTNHPEIKGLDICRYYGPLPKRSDSIDHVFTIKGPYTKFGYKYFVSNLLTDNYTTELFPSVFFNDPFNSYKELYVCVDGVSCGNDPTVGFAPVSGTNIKKTAQFFDLWRAFDLGLNYAEILKKFIGPAILNADDLFDLNDRVLWVISERRYKGSYPFSIGVAGRKGEELRFDFSVRKGSLHLNSVSSTSLNQGDYP